MKSFLGLILAFSAFLFIIGPTMAEQDDASSSMFDLDIMDSDTNTTQTLDSGEGDDLNSNLSSVILGQGNSISSTSVQVYGSGSAVGKSNITISEIHQLGDNNFAAISLNNN